MTYIGAETVITDNWIEDKLTASAPLGAIVGSRIFNTYAPVEITVYPLVIFQLQAPHDVRGVGEARIMVDTLYVVKAIAQGPDYKKLVPAASALDAAMTSLNGSSTTGGLVLTCAREDPFALTTVEDGKQFRHLGGIYRLYAQAT